MTVVAAVIEHQGLVLICQRKPGQWHALKWEFPGGKVEPGESPPDAIRRELDEELGIVAKIGPVIAEYDYQYPERQPIRLIFYSITEFNGEVKNRVFAQIRWEDRKRLPEYDFLEGDVDFVRALAANRQTQL
ncbi:MAG TPA: (deoxy)nucleoside triphosphate pyrophosphohydrolase [Bryobacteraceae bacterium]|nr:(deoxy)nucleoside triphosphate pyrophosphohydrolase [Bryobacteraceae bacterium]